MRLIGAVCVNQDIIHDLHTCRGEAASKGVHEEIGSILADLTPIVNIAFFSLAGASLMLVSSACFTVPSSYTSP